MLFLFFIFTKSNAQSAPVDWTTVRVVTEDLPPLGYIDKQDQKLKGATAEQVQSAMNKLGMKTGIDVYPWARALDMVQNSADVFIFNLARTAEREKLFQWVYKTAEKKVGVFALKSRKDITIHSFNDLKKYKIVVLDQNIVHLSLLKKGFDKISNDYFYPMSSEANIVRFIFSGRADIWIRTYTDQHDLDRQIANSGYDPKQCVLLFEIPDMISELYLATSLKTSSEKVRKFRDAMISVE
jgi:polar amino acid transport system substrate-binding protein